MKRTWETRRRRRRRIHRRLNKNLEPAKPKPAPSLRCNLCEEVIPASTHQLHLETKHGKTLPARTALAYFAVATPSSAVAP